METLSVVGLLTLGFAAANLAVHLGASRLNERGEDAPAPSPRTMRERPPTSRVDGPPQTWGNRQDLRLAIGHDFAAKDVEDQVWPRG